jgi:signal peptidase I
LTITQSTPQTTIPTPQPRSSGLCIALRFVLLVVGGYLLLSFATERVVVDGMSMEATLYAGQLLLVSRFHYWLSVPQRGDIVIFHLAANSERDFIKRVIGLPRETVELRAGQVYINGRMWHEPYVIESCDPTLCPDSIWQIGADEYFVMGDNRNYSRDSRSFGAIPRTALVGKAILRYWHFSEFQWLHQIGLNDD